MRALYKWAMIDSKPKGFRLILMDCLAVSIFLLGTMLITNCAILLISGFTIGCSVACVINLIIGSYAWTYYDIGEDL